MPTKEEKHHSSGGGSSSSSSSSSNSSSGSGTEKHKYCLLCNRNEFTLKSFDPSIEKDLRAIYNIDVINFLICKNIVSVCALFLTTFAVCIFY